VKYANYQPQSQSEAEADRHDTIESQQPFQGEQELVDVGVSVGRASASVSLNPLTMMRRKDYVELDL
jgi:hypothetical protein